MSFFIKDDVLFPLKMMNGQKNIIKSGIKSATLLKNDLAKNHYVVKKTKIKADEGKINTNFHNDKMLEKGSHCLSVVLIDSVFKMGKNYYPQVSLEECKNTAKEKEKLDITEDTEISYDESDESDGE